MSLTYTFTFPEIVAILFNLIAPPIIQRLKRWCPTYATRFVLAIIFSTITGVIGVLVANQWDLANVVGTIVYCIMASQIAYNLFWHDILK